MCIVKGVTGTAKNRMIIFNLYLQLYRALQRFTAHRFDFGTPHFIVFTFAALISIIQSLVKLVNQMKYLTAEETYIFPQVLVGNKTVVK